MEGRGGLRAGGGGGGGGGGRRTGCESLKRKFLSSYK